MAAVRNVAGANHNHHQPALGDVRGCILADLGRDWWKHTLCVVAGVRLVAASDRFNVVTVCGRDDKLRARLEANDLGTVIGWTDEMPALMSACDALVENAGGLSCMEAYAARLPVVSFLPIAGHGRENAQWMSSYGSNRYAQSDDEHDPFTVA